MTDILEKIKKSEKKLFVGLAGPGTGKSYTFGTIIKSDEYKGKKILILSFINKLINDLSEEFKDFENVKVLTLHAFAKQNIGEVDLDQDLDDNISKDYFFIRKNGISYEEKFYENNLTKDEEEFYKERKNFYKHKKNLYSFNSIIYAINRFFINNESKIPEHDLILIDEFQDFNKSEYELIKLLNKKSKIVLVGDDYQSLYDWKKAEPKQISDLYSDDSTEEFSLDYCYRCTEVIVDATNDLIKNAKRSDYLKDRLDKKFLYPKDDKNHKIKNEISQKYPKIDFIPSVPGNLLIYKLAQNIKKDIKDQGGKKILILAPNYLKQTLYEGLITEGFNIVEIELFSNEKCNEIKHKNLIEIFKILTKRKTDNLALRKILFLYLTENKIKDIIIQSSKEEKKIWNCLTKKTKENIEKDIQIFKIVRQGKNKLKDEELKRFSEIFTLKNIFSKMIKGFKPIIKDAIEIEMTTVMSSKGLSANFVYYVGIDDQNVLDQKTKKITDQKICEFLVGITRAKEKLTLISLKDENPKILEFIDEKYINKIK